MWKVTLEYTTTHFNILGQTRRGNPSSTFHTHQLTLNFLMLVWLGPVRYESNTMDPPAPLRGHPDERASPLERSLDIVNQNINVLISTPDENPSLLKTDGPTRGVPLCAHFQPINQFSIHYLWLSKKY